jgi:hypothetical protein
MDKLTNTDKPQIAYSECYVQYLDGEIWKGIELFEGLYEVSNYGRVRSTDYLIEVNGGSYWHKGKILKQQLSNCRELTACISCAQLGFKRSPYLVNRLVANAFIPNPINFRYAMHINENNLDNRVENLQWATPTECVRKYTAQKRRISSLKEVKKGTMPSDSFFENQRLGLIKSQLTRRRSVDVFDKNNNFIKTFNTVKEANDYYNLSNGCIHTMIKRGKGIGKIKDYIFKFQNY